ncbi:MAG: hypothetical protein P8H56_06785 [Crocinitomicaceae bacterium]|nr:hypothetical protein [Crocinitomicaceae bacterium]
MGGQVQKMESLEDFNGLFHRIKKRLNMAIIHMYISIMDVQVWGQAIFT